MRRQRLRGWFPRASSGSARLPISLSLFVFHYPRKCAELGTTDGLWSKAVAPLGRAFGCGCVSCGPADVPSFLVGSDVCRVAGALGKVSHPSAKSAEGWGTLSVGGISAILAIRARSFAA